MKGGYVSFRTGFAFGKRSPASVGQDRRLRSGARHAALTKARQEQEARRPVERNPLFKRDDE